MSFMEIDLATLPEGNTYEDRYSGYLDVFRAAASCDASEVLIRQPPASWVPLLRYLNCHTCDPRIVFEHDKLVLKVLGHKQHRFDRTAVEVLCGFRPETTDALWKVDMQWNVAPNRRSILEGKKEFIVTTNGSFHRPEVMHYLRNVLPNYVPEKRKVVLVPCAADKPYPAKLHKEVLARMPDDFYLAIATGVLGIVPQDLWLQMPSYDSGVPYEWRLRNVLIDYLRRVPHEQIVVYSDFYSMAIEDAVWVAEHSQKTFHVNPIQFYDDYLNLLDPQRLKKLEDRFAGLSAKGVGV